MLSVLQQLLKLNYVAESEQARAWGVRRRSARSFPPLTALLSFTFFTPLLLLFFPPARSSFSSFVCLLPSRAILLFSWLVFNRHDTANPPLLFSTVSLNLLTPFLFICLSPSCSLSLPLRVMTLPLSHDKNREAGIEWLASRLSPALRARAVKGSFVRRALHHLGRYVLCCPHGEGFGPTGNFGAHGKMWAS